MIKVSLSVSRPVFVSSRIFFPLWHMQNLSLVALVLFHSVKSGSARSRSSAWFSTSHTWLHRSLRMLYIFRLGLSRPVRFLRLVLVFVLANLAPTAGQGSNSSSSTFSPSASRTGLSDGAFNSKSSTVHVTPNSKKKSVAVPVPQVLNFDQHSTYPFVMLVSCSCSLRLVPVYDGTSTTLDLDKDLSNIGNLLPSFDDEVPSDSFVCVGHTVQAYSKLDGSAGVSFNILWVIILSMPHY